MARCPQRVHSSRCPPSAAVRHRAMASSALACFQVIHLRLRSMNAFPAARTRSATSSGGRLTYWSCGDSSFSFSESRGLAVAFRRRCERCRYFLCAAAHWPGVILPIMGGVPVNVLMIGGCGFYDRLGWQLLMRVGIVNNFARCDCRHGHKGNVEMRSEPVF
jgi:hypothetical protein